MKAIALIAVLFVFGSAAQVAADFNAVEAPAQVSQVPRLGNPNLRRQVAPNNGSMARQVRQPIPGYTSGGNPGIYANGNGNPGYTNGGNPRYNGRYTNGNLGYSGQAYQNGGNPGIYANGNGNLGYSNGGNPYAAESSCFPSDGWGDCDDDFFSINVGLGDYDNQFNIGYTKGIPPVYPGYGYPGGCGPGYGYPGYGLGYPGYGYPGGCGPGYGYSSNFPGSGLGFGHEVIDAGYQAGLHVAARRRLLLDANNAYDAGKCTGAQMYCLPNTRF